MKIRKINKLKLFVSGLILSLALGVVNYDILFLSDYDYRSCENKENTELVVSKTFELEHTSYYFSYLSQDNIDFQRNKQTLVHRLLLRFHNAKTLQLFNTQYKK